MLPLKRKRTQKEKQTDGAIKVKKLNSKKCKKTCYIYVLPNDILLKIIGYIPYWHMPRLRKSCKFLRTATDMALLHEFQSAIFESNRRNPKSLESVALTAINDATCHYVSYGFGSIFCGTILPLIWNNHKFIPEEDKIKSFLKHFYKMVNEKCGSPNSQFSRLLYCATLMGLLKKFKNSRLMSSALIKPNYWRNTLELRGPWLGVLWSQNAPTEPHERIKMLMILTELLIADGTNQAFKKVWECDSEIFVFGNDASAAVATSKKPTTVFTFKINAPNKIFSLLNSCLKDEVVQWPNRLPNNEFIISIDISCKNIVKWGCRQVHHLEIGPHFDEVDENDETEDEDDENEEMDMFRTISAEPILEIS